MKVRKITKTFLVMLLVLAMLFVSACGANGGQTTNVSNNTNVAENTNVADNTNAVDNTNVADNTNANDNTNVVEPRSTELFIDGVLVPDSRDEDKRGNLATLANLTEHVETLSDGREHIWQEYIPDLYTGKESVPLFVCLHGGSGTGLGAAESSGWAYLAERENFIAIYPNATDKTGTEFRINSWNYDYVDDNYDVEYIKLLIELVCERYNIDKTRIYMGGFSNGDMMTLRFAMEYGDMLAGMFNNCGGTVPLYFLFEDGSRFNDADPVAAIPVYQWRGAKDLMFPALLFDFDFEKHGIDPDSIVTNAQDPELIDYQKKGYVNEFNKELWIKENGTSTLPEISIIGDQNLEIYRGGVGDVFYIEYVGQGHTQFYTNTEQFWQNIMSRYARSADGKIVELKKETTLNGDVGAIGLVPDTNKVYINNKIVELKRPVKLTNNVLYASVDLLEKAFGAKISYFDDGKQAVIELDGKKIAIAENVAMVTVDNQLRQLFTQSVLSDEGTLMIPVENFMEQILGLCYTSFNNAAYVSDHFGNMSYSTSATLYKILQ